MSENGTSRSALARCLQEIAEFVDAEGWDEPPQLFALVYTSELTAAEPALLDQLADGDELTPIKQDALPYGVDGAAHSLEEYLATTSWPPTVAGCALVQQIVVLPPGAESDLDTALLHPDLDAADAAARAAAVAHPERKDARLFAAVLHDGPSVSMLQLRPDDDFAELELLTGPDLAPNLIEALYATFA